MLPPVPSRTRPGRLVGLAVGTIVIVLVPAPSAPEFVTTSEPWLTVTPPVNVLLGFVRTHRPSPVLVRLVAFAAWFVRAMANVLLPVFVPARVRVRVPADSNRLVFVPLNVKLTVAAGVVPDA